MGSPGLVATIAERIARAALGIPEPASQPVPVKLGRRCEGAYRTPEKARLSLQWRGGKLFAQREKERPIELLRDGDAIAATAARSESATASAGPTT